jgi:hypothetical protein
LFLRKGRIRSTNDGSALMVFGPLSPHAHLFCEL